MELVAQCSHNEKSGQLGAVECQIGKKVCSHVNDSVCEVWYHGHYMDTSLLCLLQSPQCGSFIQGQHDVIFTINDTERDIIVGISQ